MSLLEVVPEEEKELSNNPTERISPLKETPQKSIINQSPTEKNISGGMSGMEERINSMSRISSPAEIMSSREEHIVINVRDRGEESSSESDKKKHVGTLDSMLDFDTFEIHGQQHDQDWNHEDNQGAQTDNHGQGEGEGESFLPSLDFTLAQVEAEPEVEKQAEQNGEENNENHEQQEQQEEGNHEINRNNEEKEDGQIENNNENQENQGSLVSVI